MNKKKIILFVLCLCLILGAFLGYKLWHYENANAFYLSYKRGESLYKQQKALVKSVNPDVMEELGINVTYKERSSDLYGMTKIEKGVSYTFFPHAEEGSASAALTRIRDKERLCSFWFEKNLDKIDVIFTEVSEDQTIIYKENAVKIYKKLFKDIYENWEIQ